VLLTGWRGETPFVDPLCGSGTLPIEATWLALRRPPGLTRKRFGFQGWMDFDIGLWAALRDEARQQGLRKLPAPVIGSDLRRDVVNFAEGNARAAGVGHLIQFETKDIAQLRPPDGPPGTLLCNPPYGERLGDENELRGLYSALGEVLRRHFQGWTAFVFTGNPMLADQVGIRSARQIPLFNGKIPCRLLRYDLGNEKRGSPD
jgi:putative N6-adenine-specific DNA methylase